MTIRGLLVRVAVAALLVWGAWSLGAGVVRTGQAVATTLDGHNQAIDTAAAYAQAAR